MDIVKSKSFKNGTVYCLRLADGMLIEMTDTFLPYYTKDAIGRKQNFLDNDNLGNRSERWMIGVSTMSGCPVRCKFCATGNMKRYRNLTADEIFGEAEFAIEQAGFGGGYQGGAQILRHAEPLTSSRREEMLLPSLRHAGMLRAGARLPAGRRIPAAGPVLRPSPQRLLEHHGNPAGF